MGKVLTLYYLSYFIVMIINISMLDFVFFRCILGGLLGVMVHLLDTSLAYSFTSKIITVKEYRAKSVKEKRSST